MSNLVIVAIPDENDRVWKVSSEKIPHLTVLFLGEADEVTNLESIIGFVQHATDTSLRRFYLPVDRRDELGEDQADVLFFKKNRYDFKALWDFRAALLKNDNIRTAHDVATQHEGVWQPHLTLGYPASPAKPESEEWGSFYSVDFNKIAVWVDDYDGPEFLLKDAWDEYEMLDSAPLAVAMADLKISELRQVGDTMSQQQFATPEEALAHFGVKGMKWGVRKDNVGGAARAVGSGAKAAGRGVGKAAGGAVKLGLDVRFENKVADGRAREEVVSKAHKPFKKEDLPAVKARHGDYGKLTNRAKKPFSKEARAYRKDARETYIKRLETTANSITNASGNRQYTVRERGIDLPAAGGTLPRSKYFWDVSSRNVEHAAEDAFTRLEVIFDDEGWITDLKLVPIEDSMAQMADLGAEFLEHFGVKGMRWGVRKVPPTPVAPSAMSVVPHGNKRKTKVEVEGGENQPASDDAIKVAQARVKLAKSGPASLSNSELRDVANRLQLENQVKQLTQSGVRSS